MKKEKIQDEYNKKIKLFKEYNKFYYDQNNPVISDSDYDDLKKTIILLEEKYNFLKSEFSPSKTVGYKPSKSFKKSLHRTPMLSLANAFTEEDLLNFEKKNPKFFI